MRKILWLSLLSTLLLAVVFGMLEPMQIKAQQKSYCLSSDIYYAMASVQSVHFSGWYINPISGEKRDIEGWIKDGVMLRLREEGGPDTCYCDNRSVEIYEGNGFKHATIRPGLSTLWVHQGQSYLRIFTCPRTLLMPIEDDNTTPMEYEQVEGPDGTAAIVVKMEDYASLTVVTVDVDSWLPIKWEEYDPNGRLVGVVDRFEYNIKAPDSVFEARIPDSLPVIDLSSRSSMIESQQSARKLCGPKAKLLMNVAPGDKGTIGNRQELVFEALGPRGITVIRIAGGNRCRVIGKAYVLNRNHSCSGRILEDEDIDLTKALCCGNDSYN